MPTSILRLPQLLMSPLNILVLTAYPPGLGLHGGAQRMYYNLKILASRHRVTLISFIEHENERGLLQKAGAAGSGSARAVRRLPVPVRHLWIPRPAEHYEFAGAEMAAEVRQVLGSRQVDVIQAEYLQMAQHVPRDGVRRKVLTLHEVQYANAAQAFREGRQPMDRGREVVRLDGAAQLRGPVLCALRRRGLHDRRGRSTPGGIRASIQAVYHSHWSRQRFLPERPGFR